MEKVTSSLVVYFEDPFWVGMFSRTEDGKESFCKVTFGGEPKDNEILAFILEQYAYLSFSEGTPYEAKPLAKNPKRRQRQIQRQFQTPRKGTKAQRALQEDLSNKKKVRQKSRRARKQAKKQHLFKLKQQKKKTKHKGH
jgi:hypothetical protein